MRRRVLLALFIIGVAIVGSSLYFGAHMIVASRAHGETFEDIHVRYVLGTREEARQALLDEIALVSSKAYDQVPDSRPHLLWLAYCRLFALDTFAGNDRLADADYEQARLWDQQVAQAAGESQGAVEAELRAFSRERCIEVAKAFDKHVPSHYASRPAGQGTTRATTQGELNISVLK